MNGKHQFQESGSFVGAGGEGENEVEEGYTEDIRCVDASGGDSRGWSCSPYTLNILVFASLLYLKNSPQFLFKNCLERK